MHGCGIHIAVRERHLRVNVFLHNNNNNNSNNNNNNVNNVSVYHRHCLLWNESVLVTGRTAVEFASRHAEYVNVILELCRRCGAILMLVIKFMFCEHPLIPNLTRYSRPEPH
jgi:hypothetical protein